MDLRTRLRLLAFSVCLDFCHDTLAASVMKVEGYENSQQRMRCKTSNSKDIKWVKLSKEAGTKYLDANSQENVQGVAFFDGTLVERTGRASVDKYGTLTIKGLQLTDEGIYLCRNSSNGRHTLRAFNLQIYVKPKSSSVSFRGFPSIDQRDAWVTCKVKRVKPANLITYKWRVDGKETMQNVSKRVSNNSDSTVGVTYIYLLSARRPGCIDVQCILVWNNTAMYHISKEMSLIYEKSKADSQERPKFKKTAGTPCGADAGVVGATRARPLHSVTIAVSFVLAMFIAIAIVIYRRNHPRTYPQGYTDIKNKSDEEPKATKEINAVNDGRQVPQENDRKSSSEASRPKSGDQGETNVADGQAPKRRPTREDNYIEVEIVPKDNTSAAQAKHKRHSNTVYADIDFAKSP